MKRLTILLISFYIGVVNADEETYLCVTDQTTGFVLRNDKWTTGDFAPDKYILKLDAQGNGTFYDFGGDQPKAPNCIDLSWIYDCTNIYGKQFKFRREMNRFAVVHFMPYLREDKTGNNWFSIGTCSKI